MVPPEIQDPAPAEEPGYVYLVSMPTDSGPRPYAVFQDRDQANQCARSNGANRPGRVYRVPMNRDYQQDIMTVVDLDPVAGVKFQRVEVESIN